MGEDERTHRAFTHRDVEMSALDVQQDTLNIILCNRVNSYMSDKHRALKVAKCCKVIRDRTKDKQLYSFCRTVIKGVSAGLYERVVKSIDTAEYGYLLERGLSDER